MLVLTVITNQTRVRNLLMPQVTTKRVILQSDSAPKNQVGKKWGYKAKKRGGVHVGYVDGAQRDGHQIGGARSGVVEKMRSFICLAESAHWDLTD